MSDVAESTVVDGRYRVVNRIGAGGMAEVWCAEDLQLGRPVALKLLHERFAEDGEFVERFRREASSAAGLQHPNVVSVYDRGEWDGTSYIAMEFVDGEPLKALVEREGPLEPGRAIDLTLQVLRAARFAHRRGIVHRDLKPHNVIVDGEGRAKVADFGIARAGASDMTETGSIMGTAQYLSPEQAQGHAVSPRSDLYAIGIVLYELLTGGVPFDGESAVTIALKQVAEEPVPPSRLSPAVGSPLDAVVLRALAKDPDQRFPDADAFMAALQAVRAGTAPPLPPGPVTASFGPLVMDGATALPPAEPEAPRRRAWWPWALAALVLLLGLGATVLLAGRTERRLVPEVVGAEQASAARRLRDEGFRPVIRRVRDAAPRDQVIRQSPRPSAELEVGAAVTLVVSDGPGRAEVPDVAGQARRVAERRLEDAGFEVRVRRIAHPTIPEGRAVRTAPPAGRRATVGSRLTLYLSRGPGSVVVPAVVGQAQRDARAALRRVGLTAAIQREPSEGTPGTVVRQAPGAGVAVTAGATVTLIVATAPVTAAEEERATATEGPAAADEQVDVPFVVGSTQADATQRLSAAGFTVVTETRDVPPGEQDGQVLEQSRSGAARRGSAVTIVVGRFDDSAIDPGDGGTGGATPDGGDGTGGTGGAAPG